MFRTVRVEADGALGRLVLDRPDKLNPLSPETLRELAAAARWFDERSEVRAVIVTGAGRAFSAGADLAMLSAPGAEPPRAAADAGRLMAEAIEAMQAVTIAAIRGWCVGGGVVLASACDLRLVADDARFWIPEVDLGLPLGWGGIPRLVREIGPARTKELVITCRPFDAEEAHRMGFVNRVVPADRLDAEAELLAQEVAGKASFAVWATKRHVDAVTAQMVGVARSWGDADGLVTAQQDPEAAAARRRYLEARRR